jgi:hypothetical protein
VITDHRLGDLSGATLDQLAVDWRNGIARLTFLPSPAMRESYALRATDVIRVDVARGAGASRIVREVREVTRDASHTTVEVAMESGEVLRLEARSIAIDGIGG